MNRKQARSLKVGDLVRYTPHQGSKRVGTVARDGVMGKVVNVHLDGDPFPINTSCVQVERLDQGKNKKEKATVAAKTVSTLRKEAKAAGVKGWDEMSREELVKALKGKKPKATSKKGSTAKAPKTKGRVKKVKPKSERTKNPDGIPWKEGSNMHTFAKAIQKGGKRSTLVKELKKKVDLKPRKNKKDFDLEEQLDRRLMITAQALEKEGWTIDRDGRGPDAKIKGTPPS